MPEDLRKRSIRDHVQYIGSAGLSLTLGEFLAEYVARASQATSWQKVAAKGITKGIWSAVLMYLGSKISDDRLARTLEIAAYANLATWILDIIYQLYPGGLWGIIQTLTMRKATTVPTGTSPLALSLSTRRLPQAGIITTSSTPFGPVQVAQGGRSY